MTPHCSEPTCRKPIEWVETEYGKSMPLDVGEFTEGNIRMVQKEGRWVAHALSQTERMADAAGAVVPPKYRRAHFSTCPARKRFRRKK